MNTKHQQIDPRFAAAHYEHDLKPVVDLKASEGVHLKAQLRIKTPNVWELLATAEKALAHIEKQEQYIATLESEARRLDGIDSIQSAILEAGNHLAIVMAEHPYCDHIQVVKNYADIKREAMAKTTKGRK